MDFENLPLVTVDEYLDMIRQKTAVLLGFSLEMGAILAGAPKVECDKLYKVGVNLGLAFQLQDDLLDLYGGSDFGKQVGGDVINKKKSILITKALELSSNKEELLKIYNSLLEQIPDKVNIITTEFDRLKVESQVKLMIADYEKIANQNLSDFKTANLDTLSTYINLLKSRVK